MTICDIIRLANEEFEANGRSERFVKFEQRILRTKNALSVYFFARYVKGIDVEAFQNAILDLGDMVVARYFAQYIPNADINAFYQYAKQNNLYMWAEAFMEIFDIKTEPKSLERAKKKRERICDGQENSPADIKLDTLIDKANKEYRKNGRSEKFIEMETRAVHIESSGNMFLFAKNVDGVSRKQVEKSLLMRGEPKSITMCALNLNGLSPDILLMGLDVMKNDYIKLEKDKNREIILERLNKQLKKAILKNNKDKIEELEEQIQEISKKFAYLDEIRFCKSQIKEYYAFKN